MFSLRAINCAFSWRRQQFYSLLKEKRKFAFALKKTHLRAFLKKRTVAFFVKEKQIYFLFTKQHICLFFFRKKSSNLTMFFKKSVNSFFYSRKTNLTLSVRKTWICLLRENRMFFFITHIWCCFRRTLLFLKEIQFCLLLKKKIRLALKKKANLFFS